MDTFGPLRAEPASRGCAPGRARPGHAALDVASAIEREQANEAHGRRIGLAMLAVLVTSLAAGITGAIVLSAQARIVSPTVTIRGTAIPHQHLVTHER